MPKDLTRTGQRLVDLDLIIAPEGNVRLDIPERGIFELSESMKEIGLIQPILLTPNNDKLEVVAGQRRWLAAKLLKWKAIKADVRKLTKQQIAVIRANENLQREDLSSIEEAAIYADLFDTYHFTVKMIATHIGKAASTVTGIMDLLKMDEHLQIAIHKGQITRSVAKELHKIDDKKDLYRYLDIAIENGVTATVAAQWTEEYRKGLQYVNSEERPPSPLPEIERPDKYFTMCQTCEGPMEYKDMCTIKICKKCYDLILKVVEQGYFKEGGT